MHSQEFEVKYHIRDLAGLERRLKALGAQLSQPRTFETNLRFDTPDGALRRGYQVLRLRQDTAARMTYKGPSESRDGVRLRPEYEFEVSDFEAARALIEALGYQVSMAYEKYRTVYDLGEVHVTLDELPYGHFAELEGPDPASIQAVNRQLQLDWSRRAPDSYAAIFERLREVLGLDCRDLTFANFEGVEVDLGALGILEGD